MWEQVVPNHLLLAFVIDFEFLANRRRGGRRIDREATLYVVLWSIRESQGEMRAYSGRGEVHGKVADLSGFSHGDESGHITMSEDAMP